MTDQPLYLPASMISAFVAGRVSLLVEPLKVQPPEWCDQDRKPGYSVLTPPGHIEFCGRYVDPDGVDHGPAAKFIPIPHAPGDRLWLREAWACHSYPKPGEYAYLADPAHRGGKSPGLNWMFAEEMPMRISRAWAEVEEVGVQRVQDVTEVECKAAGFPGFYAAHHPDTGVTDGEMPSEEFARHFTATHGPDAWKRNPWCAFTRIKVHMGSLEGKA